MFEVAIYEYDKLITIVSVGHPCLMDFIKTTPEQYKLQIVMYKSVVKG